MLFCKSEKKQQGINPIFLAMPWVIFLQFMQNFNENVFYLITPNIASTFAISPAIVSWVVTIAGFAFGIGGGIYAALADIISMKKLFVFGIVAFSLGSVLGFIFQNYYIVVILGRFIQTIGAGVAPACIVVLIARYVPETHKAIYFGYTTAVFQLSAGVGHFAGGYITTLISWQYSFLLPVISLICLPAFIKYLPDEHLRSTKLDIKGAVVLSLLILLYLIALTSLNIYCFIVGVLLTIYFIYYCLSKERQGKVPFVSFSIFKDRKYTLGVVVAFMLFGTQNGFFFIFPFIMERVYHVEASVIGLIYLPTNVVAFIIGLCLGRIVKRTGCEHSVYIGVTLIITGLFLFWVLITQHILWMALALLVFSCGYPFFYVGFFDSYTAILPREKIGKAMGVYNILINLLTLVVPSAIGLIITYDFLNFRLLPIASIKGDAVEYSNIMLLLILMVLIGGIVFSYTFRGIDKLIVSIKAK